MPPPRRSEPRSPEHAALVGDAVCTPRNEAGLSQEQPAEGASTDLTQVCGIERGVRNPSYTTLLRLASALNTSVGNLTTLPDELRAQA